MDVNFKKKKWEQNVRQNGQCSLPLDTSLQVLGKLVDIYIYESFSDVGGGPIFKVVLKC